MTAATATPQMASAFPLPPLLLPVPLCWQCCCATAWQCCCVCQRICQNASTRNMCRTRRADDPNVWLRADVMVCSNPQGACWGVSKRFSEFAMLRDALLEADLHGAFTYNR